jgi:hypothetical protein
LHPKETNKTKQNKQIFLKYFFESMPKSRKLNKNNFGFSSLVRGQT